ncbi:MAG: hypothetical protein AB8F95_21760 [Bacteroidia bacterium]
MTFKTTISSLILACLCMLAGPALFAQKKPISIDWLTLATTVYETSEETQEGFTYQKPTFNDAILALEGKRVRLTGYMLPLTVDQDLYILSRYSFTECYFCNPNSGKASVIELKLRKDGKRFPLDKTMRWEGTLTLSKDPFGLTFILEDAVVVKG